MNDISSVQTFVRQQQVDLDAFAHHKQHQVAVKFGQVELPLCLVENMPAENIRTEATCDALFLPNSICRATKSIKHKIKVEKTFIILT